MQDLLDDVLFLELGLRVKDDLQRDELVDTIEHVVDGTSDGDVLDAVRPEAGPVVTICVNDRRLLVTERCDFGPGCLVFADVDDLILQVVLVECAVGGRALHAARLAEDDDLASAHDGASFRYVDPGRFISRSIDSTKKGNTASCEWYSTLQDGGICSSL